MRISLKVVVEDFQSLWGEGGSPLPFLGGLHSHKLVEVLVPIFVALLRLLHPPLQHGLDLLSTLRSDVQLLEPVAKHTSFVVSGASVLLRIVHMFLLCGPLIILKLDIQNVARKL